MMRKVEDMHKRQELVLQQFRNIEVRCLHSERKAGMRAGDRSVIDMLMPLRCVLCAGVDARCRSKNVDFAG